MIEDLMRTRITEIDAEIKRIHEARLARELEQVPGIGDYAQPYGERNVIGTEQIEEDEQ